MDAFCVFRANGLNGRRCVDRPWAIGDGSPDSESISLAQKYVGRESLPQGDFGPVFALPLLGKLCHIFWLSKSKSFASPVRRVSRVRID